MPLQIQVFSFSNSVISALNEHKNDIFICSDLRMESWFEIQHLIRDNQGSAFHD